jgi:F0F1-type ATP synthase assembly protein I
MKLTREQAELASEAMLSEPRRAQEKKKEKIERRKVKADVKLAVPWLIGGIVAGLAIVGIIGHYFTDAMRFIIVAPSIGGIMGLSIAQAISERKKQRGID